MLRPLVFENFPAAVQNAQCSRRTFPTSDLESALSPRSCLLLEAFRGRSLGTKAFTAAGLSLILGLFSARSEGIHFFFFFFLSIFFAL